MLLFITKKFCVNTFLKSTTSTATSRYSLWATSLAQKAFHWPQHGHGHTRSQMHISFNDLDTIDGLCSILMIISLMEIIVLLFLFPPPPAVASSSSFLASCCSSQNINKEKKRVHLSEYCTVWSILCPFSLIFMTDH